MAANASARVMNAVPPFQHRSARKRGGLSRPSSILALLGLFLFVLPQGAAAAIRMDFYSKDMGRSFPHAFVAFSGTVNATGEQVSANYGFTAKRISPAVLVGSIAGEVASADADYIAKSVRHFSIVLSDEEYAAVMVQVRAWTSLKQPSYNLNKRNCVSFVASLAQAAGLRIGQYKDVIKKPYAFVQRLMADNATLLSSRTQAQTPSSSLARQ